MAHVSEKKKKEVKELIDLLSNNSIIAVVDLESLPAKQLQMMREKLRDTVKIRMSKKRLMKIAFKEVENSKKGISKLADHLKGMSALLFSEENPFKLFKILKENKSSAPAKPGQIAPKDVVVKAGKTNFAPGPIISELASVGIKTQVDGGKLAIKEDVVVAKEGDEISEKLAKILQRLGIEPMEIGLNLTAIYENGDILTKDILDIDVDEYLNNITQAHTFALNLSVEAGIFNDASTELLITKAVRDSRALSLEVGFMTDETKEELLARAERIASNLKASLQI
jgi:large subunit ribosomal protein L10